MPTPNAWTKAHRKMLSAIRHPQPVDPKDFHLSAAAGWAALGETGPLPEALDPAVEAKRAPRLASSWKTAKGRCFSDEPWNACIAVWARVGGWGFVIDQILPTDADPKESIYYGDGGPWYQVRRYLHHATPAERAAATELVRPVFEALCVEAPVSLLSGEAWKFRLRDFLAAAFDQDTGWPDRLLRAHLAVERSRFGSADSYAAVVAASTDPDLVLAAVEKTRLTSPHSVFDIVESIGARAADVLVHTKPYNRPEEKRIEAARAVALSL